MGQEEFLNPVPIKTLCEIFMEDPTNPMYTHTPGPWYITKDTTSGEFCTYTKVRDQRDGVIAIMSTMNEDSNARLISTAPELLEALKWALEQIADDLDPDFQEALENAQAVVERAGGYL